MVDVAEGYAFAVLAIPDFRAGNAPAPLVELSETVAVSRSLPDGALESWQGRIGAIHRRELEQTGLFVWATRRLEQGVSYDDLRRLCLRFHVGLLIAVPNVNNGRLTALTGSKQGGRLQVDSLLPYDRTWAAAGSESPQLTLGRLQLAFKLSEALSNHPESAPDDRVSRIVRTFREGCEARYGDERLHQFVRATEGFAAPWNFGDYRDRMAQFCRGRARPDLEELYRTRGSIEHLRGPYRWMPKSLSARQKVVRLFRRCVQAEALARYCLLQFLSRPALWPHFDTDEHAAAFWKLPVRDRRRLWPTRIDFPSILRDFNEAAIKS